MQWIRWGKASCLSATLILGGSLAVAQPQEETFPIQEDPSSASEFTPSDLNEQSLRLPATDLNPLNPDPKVLDVPTTPGDVKVDPNLDQAITLQQALELAKRNNRDLQIAELQLRQSKAALAEAKAAKLPTATAQASVNRIDSATTRIAIKQNEEAQISAIENQIQQLQAQLPGLNPVQAAIVDQTIQGLQADLQTVRDSRPSSVSNLFNSSVQLDYDVFTSGQRPASIQAAQSAVKAAEKSLETELQQLGLDVTNDYYDMQQADELVQIAGAAVKNAEETLANTQALEQAGLGTRFDVLRSEVQLANQQQQLSQAQSQQQTARRQLAQRLSLNPQAALSAADPVKIAGLWPLSITDTIVKAQQNRSELGELLDQRQIAQQNERLIKGSFGPQVSVSASGTFAVDLSDPTEAFGYALGGQVTKTLFDGGATKANAKQQALEAKIAETQFANFKNLIRFQVEQNFFTLQSSFKNIGTNECAVTQAEQSLELARLRLRAGIGTQLEVSNAETELTRTRSNRLQAIIDYNRALIALERFVGHRQPQARMGEVPASATQENLCNGTQSG
ncbi:TolC family protein [Acaryochloris sp. IP29b_bin.148]|uniref:TolC family protein n=1 Tax=Acaryochloris sp. IP29b_bin.148 TaxID=2969218 RepID=UPI0026174E6D|nr:TolC family protein [Acaryochloris sp. IP29b_bin.148]